ncbi:MAG: hypothetical protein JWP12_3030 [Bacteroidetes bacterium]|nr:hypothetical protein [Bacteroidota bacterium]
MKKLILSLILATTFVAGEATNDSLLNADNTTNRVAQSGSSGEKCFDEGTHIINLGAGFGSAGYYRVYRGAGYDYGATPAISLTYEQPLPKKVGPGYIGVGAYFGFQHIHARYDYYDYYFGNSPYYYEHTWNNYMIAARAAYHWDVLNSKRAEVYAGAIIGVRIQTYTYSTNNADPAYNHELNDGTVYPAYSLFAGARWYFAKNVAVFGELGYGISFATGGLSFKF